MYASVHADHTGRLLISDDHSSTGWNGADHVALTAAIPLPANARLVPLDRAAVALGRDGRQRAVGRGRSAVGAILPAGHTRLLHPSYAEDRALAPLAALPYAAVGARDGEIVVAAARHGSGTDAVAPPPDLAEALRARPRNDLLRQLSRCAKDHECRDARGAIAGAAELPVPLGAPAAERPTLPVALRSGYAGAPLGGAVLRPSPEDIRALVGEGTRRVSFGRACDGEPLLAARALEEAIGAALERAGELDVHLETTGCAPVALRRALETGVTSVTFRFASALAGTYRALHGPVAHEWNDVRASITAAADHGARIALAILVLPGVTDRPAESDAILGLIGDLPGGVIELRDLGADPLRAIAGLPRARPFGIAAVLERIREASHFRIDAPAAVV